MLARRNHVPGLALSLFLAVACCAQSGEPIETLRIESDLVDLKVSVVSLNPSNPSTELQQKDFLILEDGQPQDISFFAAAETPFNRVFQARV